MRFFLVLLVLISFFLSACNVSDEIDKARRDEAVSQCKQLCEYRLSNRFDFTNASCLDEEIINGWACQTKEKIPRPDRPNRTSPCSSYIGGKVNHFVELDSSCELSSVE
jgi:hypothetical protein